MRFNTVRTPNTPAAILGAMLCGWTLLTGCGQEPLPQGASNLLAVDDVAFVCTRTEDADGVHVERGVPLHECTERENLEEHALLALATQWETGEIAVIDATACARANDSGTTSACLMRVLDNEASLPGINFLPVGAQPVSVRSTPGGTATFVAVAEPGKTGVFALPTTCVGQRKLEEEAVRDIRTWPACRLPVAPSMLELIRDTTRSLRCDGAADSDVQSERECPADLREQELRQGRLKLAVTLPALGQLWTLDAQEVLDRAPGSYADCQPEQVVQLDAERPAELVQEVPGDLSSEARVYTELQGEWQATPTDIAVDVNASHGEVYIADRTAPVVHVLDASDACNIKQVEPLYPLSYTQADATIGTRKVALSPIIDSGKRFVYAVEESSERTSGSVMVFDVSADVSQRTPLVLPRSPLIPSQPPDRVQFSQEVSDVDFLYRDPPIVDPETGVGATGVRCDPDPDLDPDNPAAIVRPNSSGTGAGPFQLRGLFAVASLYAGYVSIIDIDDYDGACRRHQSVNPDAELNEYGCALDPWTEELETSNGPTTTGELSCNVVQPHRVRSREQFIEGQVGGVPRLAAFPRLRAEDGSSLVTDTSARGFTNPRMLAVPYSDGREAQVQVGATMYTARGEAAAELVIDPARSENSSLLLPVTEPRAYATHSGDASITYEGLVRGIGFGMFSVAQGQELAERPALAELPDGRSYGVLHEGSSARLCRAGVEDQVLMAERASALYPTADSTLSEEDYQQAFGRFYGDYAELVEDLKPASHPYWDAGGATCGADNSSDGVDGRRVCELVFGAEGEGQRARSFRVVRAFDHQLIVEPRRYSNASERANLLDLTACCFPDATSYIIRSSHQWYYREGGSPLHQITVGDEGVCERDSSPLREHLNSRAFEVSCAGDDCAGIGPSAPPEASDTVAAEWVPVCVLSEGGDPPIQPDSAMDACVFNGLTARFAVYRGQDRSQRGMVFNWRIGGGFLPFSVPLVDINTNNRTGSTSNPQRLFFSPELQRIVVTEGAPPGGGVAPGITLLGLENSQGLPSITQSRISAY